MFLKRLSFILLFTLFFSFADLDAQKEGRSLIDSIQLEVRRNGADTALVNNLNLLSSQYAAIQTDSAIYYANLALDKAKEIKWLKGEAKSLLSLSSVYARQGLYNDALKLSFDAQEKSDRLEDDKLVASINSNLGYIYLYLSDYQRALYYYQQAIKLNQKTNNEEQLVADYNSMGLISSALYKNKEALQYYEKAIHLAKKLNNRTIYAYANSNSGSIYQNMGQYSKALDYHFKALKIEDELHDNYGLATEFGSICVAYRELSQTLPAKKEIYLDSSIYYGNKSISYCLACNNLSDLALIKKELSATYALSSNYKIAYQLFSESEQLKDSLFSSENNAQVRETEAKQMDRIKEIELAKQRQLIYFALAGGLLMMAFASVFFFQRNKISKEKKRSEELLLNILPEEVAEELKEKGYAEAKSMESVTILFTDFKGFTQVSEKLTPHELVKEIDHCFRAFDNIITKYNIEKIKTIGDAYMCAGGLPIPNQTHAEDVVQAAIEIRDFIEARRLEKQPLGEPFFEIRIGIHTGNIVAGIVGVKKFAYDIWGDAVNIASRMESAGQEGKINISQSTFELIKHRFKCSHRGKIEAKNKGEIDMYFVESPIIK